MAQSAAAAANGARALRWAAGFWFLVAVAGQLVFALSVAVFYLRTVARGDPLGWDRFMTHGYIPGHTANNAAGIAHVAAAVVVMTAGALQLLPQIRARAPALHRWNGRIYLTAVAGLSLAGLWMVWIRGTPGDLAEHVGLSLDAVLILLFGAVALRHAIARDFVSHRRWALRLFVVASGVWFFRVSIILALLVLGPIGFNARTFSGPLITAMTFASYLVPLAVVELYMRARQHGSSAQRWAMAGGLGGLTLAMGAGIAVVTAGLWLPNILPVFARSTPLAEMLSLTASNGDADDALRQYHALRPAPEATDADQLNVLGYALIHAGRLTDAIRIFQAAVTAFPQSANAYDSLGEAYLDAGDKSHAVQNYRKSLALNPANRNAASAIQELLEP